MATQPTPAEAATYPLPAFYFRVKIVNLGPGSDTSFQEVRGIGPEIQTEDVVEGGENRFIHRLPKAVKNPLLELKRGIAPLKSPLVKWCRSTFESGLAVPLAPSVVDVSLLNAQGQPVRSWSFGNAFPVKWEIEDFKSTKNEVAIEKISLSYSYCSRVF